MRFLTRTFILLLPFLLLSCAPKPDLEGLKKTVDEFNVSSIEAMKSNSFEKALSYYADDAIELPPNTAAIKGKENIKAWMEKGAEMGIKMIGGKFTSTEINTAGDIGYEIGEYEMTFNMPPVGEVKDVGKYIAIFKKQQDGSWKVKAEIWNTDMPLPTAEPPKAKKK